jgi:phosphoribosylaminoimidazole-succinocarboxamide synthase
MENEFLIPGYKPFKKGKVRELYKIPNSDYDDFVLCVTTDQISAFDQVIGKIEGRGVILNSISNFWKHHFRNLIGNDLYLDDCRDVFKEFNILEDPSDLFKRSSLVWRIKVFPFEFIVRGYMTGGLFEEYKKNNCQAGRYLFDHDLPEGLKEGEELPYPIFTPSTKAEQGHDVNVGFWHVAKEIGYSQAEYVRAASIALYFMSHKYLLVRGVKVADTKFEYGQFTDSCGDKHLYLTDEVLTPDSSRFWDLDKYCPGKTQESFDKQPFRDWLDKNWGRVALPPEIPQSIKDETLARYQEIQRRIFSEPRKTSLQQMGSLETYLRITK